MIWRILFLGVLEAVAEGVRGKSQSNDKTQCHKLLERCKNGTTARLSCVECVTMAFNPQLLSCYCTRKQIDQFCGVPRPKPKPKPKPHSFPAIIGNMAWDPPWKHPLTWGPTGTATRGKLRGSPSKLRRMKEQYNNSPNFDSSGYPIGNPEQWHASRTAVPPHRSSPNRVANFSESNNETAPAPIPTNSTKLGPLSVEKSMMIQNSLFVGSIKDAKSWASAFLKTPAPSLAPTILPSPSPTVVMPTNPPTQNSQYPNLQCLFALSNSCKGCAKERGSIARADPRCRLNCLECLKSNRVSLVRAGCSLSGSEKYCGAPPPTTASAEPIHVKVVPVRIAGCPGDSLHSCIGLCPANTFEAAYKDCIEECTTRCNR